MILLAPEVDAMIFLTDLRDVGPSKPLGYLPVETIEARGGIVADVTTRLHERGLWARALHHGVVVGGALYASDLGALQKLLDGHKGVLRDVRWPLDAERFIKYVATVQVADEASALYSLIAIAFRDDRYVWYDEETGESGPRPGKEMRR